MFNIRKLRRKSSSESSESISTLEFQKEEELKSALLKLDLKEKDIAFLIEQGERYVGHPEILARKLNIEINQSKEALDQIKIFKVQQVTKNEIKEFERIIDRNPGYSLGEIALLYDVDESVVSAYLQQTQTVPLTKTQELIIKEKFDAGFMEQEISEQLRISQKKVGDYIDSEFITFNGEEGQRVLEIITRSFGKYPILKFRDLIITKNVSLQDQICFKLRNINEGHYGEVVNYFKKFKESRNFFEVDEMLSIEEKELIRSYFHDTTTMYCFGIEYLSKKINRVQKVIIDFLLQYHPDKEFMVYHREKQLQQIEKLRTYFEMDEQISHTTYRMIISESFTDLIQNAQKMVKYPNLILNELLPILFHYIKCSLPLEDLSKMISKITKIPLTTLDLFHLIFQMSDPVVRGFCIEHYSFSNPVPLYYPVFGFYSQDQTYCSSEINKELWYSVQQFNGLVSFGLGWASWNPVGKSHLLDLMFETDFMKGSPRNSPFHLGSIDVQMTKNLFGIKERNMDERTNWAYIDCHGNSDSRLIDEICQKLEIVLLHATYSDFKEHYLRIEQDLIQLTNNTQHVYLLVRDHPEHQIEMKEMFIKDKQFNIIFIPYIIDQNKDLRSELKQIGYEILHKISHKSSTKYVDSTFIERLLVKFGNSYSIERDKELSQKVVQFFQQKNTKEKDFSSLSYVPWLTEYMLCHYQALNEIDLKRIHELNHKGRMLEESIEKRKISDIARHFNEILGQENSILNLYKLALELDRYGNKEIMQVLWREVLLSHKFNENKNNNEENAFIKAFACNFYQHVEQGEPFELIDGDNLKCFNQEIDNLLKEFYVKQSYTSCQIKENEIKNAPPIVISIFGPQSSGKSTLLNYCFGCKFLTSAGRCTKGVYASFSKLSQPINNSDHFLILDTEGLDSIEKGKVLSETSCIQFDRTMVLFCLAVSQVVIINVKGEFGEEMRNLLQICGYSLQKLKVTKTAPPRIFFVLNQQVDPDPEKHLSSINTLLEDLNRGSFLMETEGIKISDIIHVSKENLFVLPSAFNSVSLNTQMTKLFDADLNKLLPTVSFANECTNLRMSIIQQLRHDETLNNYKTFSTMSEWMEMSGVIWDTIATYQDIVKYRNIEELKCSNLLNSIVSDLLKDKVYVSRDKYRSITESLINKVKNITTMSPPLVIFEDIMEDLHEIFRYNSEEALIEFNRHCQADPILKRMNYMRGEAKCNLLRLIYLEKKTYEEKIRFAINVRLSKIRAKENMAKLQVTIDEHVEENLEIDPEKQKEYFDKIWIDTSGNTDQEEDEFEKDDLFNYLFSLFIAESKSMENKSIMYSRFLDLNFEMDKIVQALEKEIIADFCTKPKIFSEKGNFFFLWERDRAPLKDMIPYQGKNQCEYLIKETLWLPFRDQSNCTLRKINLQFQDWVPSSCYQLIKRYSGYYTNSPIIWIPRKRKQILLLASQLKQPNNLGRSTWEKFINDVSNVVIETINDYQDFSHSTVKEIVCLVNYICNVANYEINYIGARLTDKAERTLSAFVFAIVFKYLFEIKTESQKVIKSETDKGKERGLAYFLQKVDKLTNARGNWDRVMMRKNDMTKARIHAGDLLDSLRRSLIRTCECNLVEKYLIEKNYKLSNKNFLLLANEKLRGELRKDSIDKSSVAYVVDFVCNFCQLKRKLFHEEWQKVENELQNKIVKDLKENFTIQLSAFQLILTEILDRIASICPSSEIRFDSDSNFVVAEQRAAEDLTVREAPFKSMLLFLEMYLNPNVSPEEFNQFFNNPFEVDGIMVRKRQGTCLLCEKPSNQNYILDQELFQKCIHIKMFSSTEIIFNVKVYLEEFLHYLTGFNFQMTQEEFDKLLKPTKEHFEAHIINCPYQCPSCGKFCDKEIYPHEGRCRLMTGHQMLSMGGKVWNNDRNRTAILSMCEDYYDDTTVPIPGLKMKWYEFKECCGDQWDWSLPKDPEYVRLQMENKEKMKIIWEKYGRAILQYYASKGTRIKYVPYTSPQEIHKSLFSSNSYVCFVIDGTDLMGNMIKHVRKWVTDYIRDLEGTSNLKIIVYHGHIPPLECVQKFPNNSDFTSDEYAIIKFLENIETYSNEENEFSMLHGLATAITEVEWESGFGVKNQIVHVYIEPTNGYFNIYKATGICKQGCSFDWKRDINDRMQLLQIEYKYKRLLNSSHPNYNPS